MTERTCAACDCALDDNPVKVNVGGRTVEVCCEDCAQKLNEAQSARGSIVSVYRPAGYYLR
ncbi:MAG TPA: hypothetical protein VGC55_10525 [Dokdonella sp.]